MTGYTNALMIKKVILRPDKLYSVSELSKILQIAPYDLFKIINKSELLFELVDDKAVYKGSEIQSLIE